MTLSSAGLRDHVYLIAKQIIKSDSDPKKYKGEAKSLSKQYHAKPEDILKMIEDKVKELSK